MSFLAIDIGNTRLKWAWMTSTEPDAEVIEHGAVFLENIDQLADGDWSSLPTPDLIWGCCVASDVVRRRVIEQIDELWHAPVRWVVPSANEGPIVNGYEHPNRLGADRWVAVIAAYERITQMHRPPCPIVVVMVGTAVTVDAIDADGNFLGGLILPGHGIMLKALESGTAGLRVPTGDVVTFPQNTSDALTTGGTYAITGAIERMYRNLTQHTGQAPHCVISGGAGWKVASHLGIPYELVDALLFDGLRHLAARHQSQLLESRL